MQTGGDVDLPPFRRELQGVGQEVQEHLLHLPLVAPDHPETLVDGASQPDPASARPLSHQDQGVRDGVGQVEIRPLQLHAPASIFERSRMSLMRERRCRPDSRISWRYSVCFSLMSPNIFSARISANPMIAFSGVRSSCDMLARNSDL